MTSRNPAAKATASVPIETPAVSPGVRDCTAGAALGIGIVPFDEEGVADGEAPMDLEALTEIDGVIDADADPDAELVAVPDGEADADAEADAEAVAEAVAVADAVAELVAVAVAEAVAVAVAEGEGDGRFTNLA